MIGIKGFIVLLREPVVGANRCSDVSEYSPKNSFAELHSVCNTRVCFKQQRRRPLSVAMKNFMANEPKVGWYRAYGAPMSELNLP
ncbi:hypothetical protein [Sporomusa malonica]|nr:hypothetical protein [Sporomusa malonica]